MSNLVYCRYWRKHWFRTSLTVLVLLSFLELSAEHGYKNTFDINSVGKRLRPKFVESSSFHVPVADKARVIAKLRKLVSYVRSINKSLKSEIRRLRENGRPYYVNYAALGIDTHKENAKKSKFYADENQPSNVRLSALGFRFDRNSDLTATVPASDYHLSKYTASTTRRTQNHNKSNRTNTSSSSQRSRNCRLNKSKEKCSLQTSCSWCRTNSMCVAKEQVNEFCINSGAVKTYEEESQNENYSADHCQNHGNCHACIQLASCVWCETAGSCLPYPPRHVKLHCPNNKWYWKSCAHQPTVFFIMLPILMTISLLILIAICIKYYRVHKESMKFYSEEECAKDNYIFNWKEKSKFFSSAPDENKDFLSGNVYEKYNIIDYRKPLPEIFEVGSKSLRGREPPHLKVERKRNPTSPIFDSAVKKKDFL